MFHAGHHHRVTGRAVVAAQQFLSPPAQQAERVRAATRLVGQVVRPAAVGVDRVEMPQQPPGQQEEATLKFS